MGYSAAVETVKAAYGFVEGKDTDIHVSEAEAEVRFTKTISCNGKRCRVQANLYEAFAIAQKTRPGDDEYWIDAICINQRYLSCLEIEHSY